MKEYVDIIIPVYNAEKYLQECVNSVIRQSYKNFNLYLIDDGSTDSSFDLCCLYAQKHPNVFVIHIEHRGLPSARNAGIQNSSAKWVYFLDSDDIIDKHCLEILVNSIPNNDDTVDIIQCDYIREKIEFDNSNHLLNGSIELKNPIQDFLSSKYVDMMVCGKLWKRELVNLLFDEECIALEDVEFLSRVLLKANRMIILDYVGYYYRMTPGSIINQGLNTIKFKSSIIAHRKCVSNLHNTKYEQRTISWYYSSLFNWMVRVYLEGSDDADEIAELAKDIVKKEWNEIKRSKLSNRIKTALFFARHDKKLPFYLTALFRKKKKCEQKR